MNSTITKKVFTGIFSLIWMVSISTLALPYLHKTNFRMPYLAQQGSTVYGFGFFSVSVTIVLIILSQVKVVNKQGFFALILGLLSLGMIYLVREFIHFQGAIDHDYDSNSGIGYLILVICGLLNYIVVLAYFFWEKKKSK